MKKQIVRISILQSAKVTAVMYFVISIPFALLMGILTQFNPGHAGFSWTAMIMMPILYTLFGFLFAVFGAWIYNLVAARIGGYEFQTVDVDSKTAPYV